MTSDVSFTVFTKPWPDLSLPELARMVKTAGFDGIELPVRPGFQVTPQNVARDLPKAASIFRDEGLRIESVAGTADEPTVVACGEAKVPILRVMAPVDTEIGYRASVKRLRDGWDRLLPALKSSGVKIGVQNHYGYFVGSAVGLVELLESYDRTQVAAVLDVAHCRLSGELEEIAIDIAWPKLGMINLKNAFLRREVGPEYDDVVWDVYWTNGRQGIASWPKVAAELKRRNYRGAVCVTAEYSNPYGDGDQTGATATKLATADLEFVKSLFKD